MLAVPGIGYFAAGALFFLRRMHRASSPATTALWVVWLSLAVHAVLLALRVAEAPTAPLTAARESIVLLSLLVVVTYLLTARSFRGEGIGVVALALAGIGLVVAASTLPPQPVPAPEMLRSPWLLLHVPVMLLAYLSYAMAAVGATMYLLVSNLLKSRRGLGILRSMPTLDSLERFSHRMAEIGFPLLTAGIFTGMIWSESVWGVLFPMAPKDVVALVTWLVYAAYFHARLVRGIRGRACAWILVLGFVTVVIGYVMPAFSSGPHAFI